MPGCPRLNDPTRWRNSNRPDGSKAGRKNRVRPSAKPSATPTATATIRVAMIARWTGWVAVMSLSDNFFAERVNHTKVREHGIVLGELALCSRTTRLRAHADPSRH